MIDDENCSPLQNRNQLIPRDGDNDNYSLYGVDTVEAAKNQLTRYILAIFFVLLAIVVTLY